MKEFIFTIKISDKGQSFTLPIYGGFSIVVDWGDKIVSSITDLDGSKTHIYKDAGEYIIKITGVCPNFSFGHVGDRLLILGINQWGDVGFTNLSGGFNGCTNLTYLAYDVEGLSKVTDFSGCFSYCRFKTIPRLFDFCNVAEDFNACFAQCDCLTAIPTDLFKYCINAKSFIGCFAGCTEIKIIPTDLFRYTTEVKDFSVCFSNCEKINSKPSNLFSNFTTANLHNVFYKCSALEIHI